MLLVWICQMCHNQNYKIYKICNEANMEKTITITLTPEGNLELPPEI
ncbi:hypothetical protein ACE1CA_34470 [Aerosakkonemataceae cyanobacterium BLCC-F167]|uniref:Uncharacterized protein n=1 Tax=Floridaenema evergladense BLCC-F167 TaxID=3153639 RepID=A0ABV4WX20_9CYAN